MRLARSEQLCQLPLRTYPGGFRVTVNIEHFLKINDYVSDMCLLLKQMDMPTTLRAAEKLNEYLSEIVSNEVREPAVVVIDQVIAYGIDSMLKQTNNMIEYELSTKICLIIPASNVHFYTKAAEAFGSDVIAKFSSAAYEIEEASKCLALERSTAAAFHSIRCLEAAIRALSRCLDIPDPTKAHERNWGSMLKLFKIEIDRRWPTSTDRLSGDGQIFDDAYAALAAMQNPWRNATMHLDQKYTEEEARNVFDIIGGFMKKLASRMDEDGNPRA